ncbi:MAG: hypothetical protein GSR84_06430 [Desulfurococcales archaeon]|nr:hypothetical protein [Desulfurococcales archaeon]
MEEPQPLRGLPRRREVAALYLLYSLGELELGEAISLLSRRLCMTRRTAHGVIKRLRRLGLVRYRRGPGGVILVRAVSPEELVRAIAEPYIAGRGGDEDGCTRGPRRGRGVK